MSSIQSAIASRKKILGLGIRASQKFYEKLKKLGRGGFFQHSALQKEFQDDVRHYLSGFYVYQKQLKEVGDYHTAELIERECRAEIRELEKLDQEISNILTGRQGIINTVQQVLTTLNFASSPVFINTLRFCGMDHIADLIENLTHQRLLSGNEHSPIPGFLRRPGVFRPFER